MQLKFYTADVFTATRFGGNPLAVFPEAPPIETATMQQIAREFNLSETVFVRPPDQQQHTRRLRIFTPAAELPFAGHPTVGTALLLAWIGAITVTGAQTAIVFEEGVGPVPVTIFADGGQARTAQLTAARPPEFGPLPEGDLAALLSLERDAVLQQPYAPAAVSCGVPFLFVPLRDRESLGRAQLNIEQWRAQVAASWAPQLYLFTPDADPGVQFQARMFAPSMGVAEDPATGAAATAFGGYLAHFERPADGTARWLVAQGVEMGRPSRLEVEADCSGGAVAALRVGGAAVLVSEGVLYL